MKLDLANILEAVKAMYPNHTVKRVDLKGSLTLRKNKTKGSDDK
jgi:hypothetical protein